MCVFILFVLVVHLFRMSELNKRTCPNLHPTTSDAHTHLGVHTLAHTVDNMIGLATDGTLVMTGVNTGVATRFKDLAPQYHILQSILTFWTNSPNLLSTLRYCFGFWKRARKCQKSKLTKLSKFSSPDGSPSATVWQLWRYALNQWYQLSKLQLLSKR